MLCYEFTNGSTSEPCRVESGDPLMMKIDVTAQNAPDCGIRKISKQSSSSSSSSSPSSSSGTPLGIIGGVETEPHEFPWLVSLGYHDSDTDGKYIHGCVGALLTAQWILSSAECGGIMHRPKPSAIISAHNLDASIDWNGQIRVPINAYIRHPKFTFRLKDETPFNDIGLVKLQYPVNSSATANPVGPWGTICLPKQDSTYNGQLGNLTSVAGWGWTRPGDSGSGSSVLRKLEHFPVVSTDWCKEKYSIDVYDQANSIVCTYSEGRDTCMGDSGAPLMVKENGRWTAVGITSFGWGCAKKNWPGGSAHVSLYVDWIWQTIHSSV
ncbi:Enteropeptidase [Tyrophagus putrescentiae]|nr:Enteropeptidase [Tyrophagus putrescentiae]